MTLRKNTALALMLAMFSGTAAFAQGGPWQVDVGQQQIYTNPVATDVKVGLGVEEPDETLEVGGNALIYDNLGINTSVTPTKELYVRGQMYMNGTGFTTPSQQDKISLVGDLLGDPEMTGLGYESELVSGAGGILDNKRVLVNKAEYAHRWYINTNADGGAGAAMSLRPNGLGIGVDLPDAGVHVDAGSGQDVFRGSFNGDLRFLVAESGRTGFNVDEALADLHLNSIGSTSQMLITPGVGSSGGDAELLLGEDDDFTYGMALRYDGGDNNLYIFGQSGSAIGPHFSMARNSGRIGINYGTTPVPTAFQMATAGSVFLRPDLDVTDGSVSLMLGEDDGNGLIWRYNGVGNKLHLDGRSGGSSTGTHMTIERTSGDVSIGYGENNAPTGYKLAVDGAIIAERIRVELSGAWPDYVFTPEYSLMPIAELKSSIAQNGHLPGIPAASEMENEGMDLGDMQKRMMEKIEELTLYIIDLQDQIDTLESAKATSQTGR